MEKRFGRGGYGFRVMVEMARWLDGRDGRDGWSGRDGWYSNNSRENKDGKIRRENKEKKEGDSKENKGEGLGKQVSDYYFCPSIF